MMIYLWKEHRKVEQGSCGGRAPASPAGSVPFSIIESMPEHLPVFQPQPAEASSSIPLLRSGILAISYDICVVLGST